MASHLIQLGLFGAVVSGVVLWIMAMRYAGATRLPSKSGRPKRDLGYDSEQGSSWMPAFFDAGMTRYWNENNGWLVLRAARYGLLGFLGMAIIGFVMVAT